jgi:hypothetical protein
MASSVYSLSMYTEYIEGNRLFVKKGSNVEGRKAIL